MGIEEGGEGGVKLLLKEIVESTVLLLWPVEGMSL
jgi:hypothetical protein